VTSLLDSLAPAPADAELCAQLWATVEQSVLIGDLYAPVSAEAQDLALDCGWQLSALAERLERAASDPAELLFESQLALAQARARLAKLAPLG